jgi:hypothetical protein
VYKLKHFLLPVQFMQSGSRQINNLNLIFKVTAMLDSGVVYGIGNTVC